jgi:hypothetical protein
MADSPTFPRTLDTQALLAVVQFLEYGHLPPAELLSDQRLPAHGLGGRRVLHLAAAQALARAGKIEEGIGHLEKAGASIKEELATRDSRGRKHLRRLHALLSSHLAVRLAQARSDGATSRAADARRLAKDATDAAPEVPYLYWMRARASLLLGEPEAAVQVLESIQHAPWFRKSAEHIRSWLEVCKQPDASLFHLSSAADRLRAMCDLPGWLDRAGERLPELLRKEAARTPPGAFRLNLRFSREDLPDGSTVDDLIGASRPDDENAPTIAGLRRALQLRLGVDLPSVLLADDMPPRHVEVRVDGVVVAAAPGDTRQAERESRALGLAQGPLPLQVLALAAYRILDRLPPSADASPRAPAEHDRWAILAADRMTRKMLDADLREAGTADADPAAATAALRLWLCKHRKAATLWGNEEHRRVLRLDLSGEAALQACVAQPAGLVVPAELFRRLSAAIRRRPVGDANAGPELAPALAVRDHILRPLLRALIRPDFPDVPVLAFSEIEHPEKRAADIVI